MTNRLYQQQKQQLPISENVPQKLTQFKEKDADGHSVHAVKMCAKRKYSGHADESKANWACPNCPRRYFYDSPLEN